MIEGLAGIMDDASGFNKVIISPRWSFTEQKNVSINVNYGPSGKSIAYTFGRKDNEISMTTEGNADEVTCRILLPQRISSANAILNWNPAPSTIEKIRNSNYLVLTSMKGSTHNVRVKW